MSDKVTVTVDYEGVGQLLKGSDVQDMLMDFAGQVASNVGSDYGYSVHLTEQRAIANIYPESAEAAKDNYENNTLLNSLRL